MDDEPDLTWAQLYEPWQRLRWARRQSNFETARAAAEALGMNEATYSAYEREPDSSKHIPLTHKKAVEFARKFKVRWQWLLARDGAPFLPKPDSPQVAEAKRLVEALPPSRRAEAIQILKVLSGRS